MATSRPLRHGHSDQPHSSPLHKGLQLIKNEIDGLLDKMKKEPHFLPQQTKLDGYSTQVLLLIEKYHPKITPKQKKLLAAVIDLNEVPLMHPMMQRIAFETALREASKNLGDYLSN